MDVLVAGVEKALPQDAASLGLGAFAGKVLHSGDLALFWDQVSGVQFEFPPQSGLEPNSPSAGCCRPV